MPKVLDCGDMMITVNVSLGMKFPHVVHRDVNSAEAERRRAMSAKLLEILGSDEVKEFEAALLTRAMQALGYDELKIKANIEAREQARQEARQAEEDGRRRRRQRRMQARV